MILSDRANALTQSVTVEISSRAKELKSQGHDVIDLGFGEPDFNTPEYIIQAAKDALDEGMTKYTPSGGVLPLKEAIQRKIYEDLGLEYNTSEIIVTPGAKFALYSLFQVLLNEGDEVIIPAPYWVSYPAQVELANGIPVMINGTEESDFKITKEQLKKAITPKTKALVLNSPSNPTGMMYSERELQWIGEVCIEEDIVIVSDEIYEKLIYTDDKHVSIAQLSEELKKRTVIINGVSKSHAMTGWRIGYAAGPENIIKAMTNLASHTTSNPTSIAQYATIKAYQENDPAKIKEMNRIFSKRIEETFHLLVNIPGVSCLKPMGAFYLFPKLKETAAMNGFHRVDDWAKALLEEEKVALVPGSAFGAPEYVRISCATSLDLLKEAIRRIERFVMKHQQ